MSLLEKTALEERTLLNKERIRATKLEAALEEAGEENEAILMQAEETMRLYLEVP